MPIVERFKRAICSIKACFSGHSEPLDTTTPPRPVSIEKNGKFLRKNVDKAIGTNSVSIEESGESLKQSDNEAAGKSAPKSGHDDPASSITEPSTAISEQPQISQKTDFWLQASEKLQKKNPELFELYSLIICREEAKSGDINSNKAPKTLADTATLLEVCKTSLESMNSTSSGAGKVLEKTVKIVGLAKDFVGSAVSAEPHAAIAWAGVCLFLPLLLNPSQQDDACRKGLEELPFLIQKYSLVERICTTEISNPKSASIQHTLSNAIVELYTKILSFQAKAICQSNQSMAKGYFRKVFQVDNWEDMHRDIISTEGRCWGLAQAIDGDRCSKLLEDFNINLAELYTVGSEFLQASRETYQAVINLGRESEKREKTKEEEACLRAFRSGNLYEEQKNRNPDRVKKTCKWLLESQSFRDWRDRERSGLLWISADPGCGKSVLSKAFVNERLVAASDATIICHFFFKDISPELRSVKKALAALIHQILSLNPHLWKHVKDSWKLNGKELCNLHDSMWDIMEAIAIDATAGDIVCVIDALDECDPEHDTQKHFVQRMHTLVSGIKKCRMRFVVTSRPYAKIENIFSALNGIHAVHIAGEMESDMISQEINLVISHGVAQLDLDQKVKNHVTTCLQEMSHRTYLWLYLTMNVIRERILTSGDAERIEESMKILPATVEDAYEAILNKSPHRSDTEKLLHIIVGAERPLSTDEINVAMNIKACYNGTQTFEDIRLEDSKRYPNMLRNLCGLFIQIVDSKVYLIHQTAKEFLVETQPGKKKENFWRYCLQPDTSHRILAEACISYLFLEDFDASLDTDDTVDTYECLKTIGAKRSGCFLNYSTSFWIAHYKCAASFIDPAAIVNLCSPSNRREIWLRMDSITDTHRSWVAPMYASSENLKTIDATSLMLISYFNLYEAGKHILSSPGFDKHELEAYNGPFTPLILAIWSVSIEMVQLLIQSGADANYYLEKNKTPLKVAVKVGSLAILQSVLEVAVDERTDDAFPKTALDLATVSSNHDEIYTHDIIPMLLNSIVRPMIEGYLEWALRYAVVCKRLEIVELLINFGADPNYEICGNGRWCILTEIHGFNSRLGPAVNAGILKLLLSKTETLHCKFVKAQLASYTSFWSDEVDLVRLMLNHPRHLGLVLDGKQSPLVFAALHANMKSMELLMNEPHDINKCQAVVDWGRIYEARRFAVENGRLRSERLWGGDSDYGDSDFRDSDFRDSNSGDIEIDTLFGGIISADEKIVERLIIDGADINMITELGTPLFVAAALSSKSVVRQLIDKGARISPFDDEGIEQPSPLVIAAARGDIEIVEVLLEAGARVDKGTATVHSIIARMWRIREKFYPSAIEAAEMEGRKEMVRFLQEYKANNGITEMEVVDNVMKPGKIEELEDD